MTRTWTKYIPSIILGTLLVSCTPLKESTRVDYQDEYTFTGFLTNSISQVSCSVNYSNHDKREREALVTDCRLQTAIFYAKYKILFELGKSELVTKGSRKRIFDQTDLKNAEIILTEPQKDEIIRLYTPLIQGSIIYEKKEGSTITAIYRVTRKNLLKEIRKIALPFSYKVTHRGPSP